MSNVVTLESEGLGVDPIDFGIEVADFRQGCFTSQKVMMLVYGVSGAGKTRFASTWPAPIFLDLNKGMASIKRDGVKRIPINDWDDFKKAYRWLNEAEHDRQTVVIDTINDLQQMLLDYTVLAFPEMKRPYKSLASQSDYGFMLQEFMRVMRYFRALPFHLVLICQMSQQQFESDNIGPQLKGKTSADEVCQMMDLVGYIYKAHAGDKNRITRMMSFDSVRHVTKDRSDSLPATLSEPAFESMAQYWQKPAEEAGPQAETISLS